MWYRSLLIVMLAGGLPGRPGARAQETAPADEFLAPTSRHALSTVTPEEYAKLIRALGDPHPQVRDVATDRLCLLDTSYLPQLAGSFHRQTEFEVKRRIRYIVEYIFHRQQNAGHDGFLGVAIERSTVRVSSNPQTHQDEFGIGVKEAMAGYAARRAGMENGDIIIRLNGEPIPDGRSTTAFVQRVSSHVPGEKLELTVLRRDEPRTIVASAGEQPTTLLDGAVLESCMLTVPDAPGFRRALRVLHVEPGSPAATIGLPVRSCLLAIDDQSLNTHTPEQTLKTAVANARRNTELRFTLAEAREVTLDVILGTRPVTLIDNPQVLQEARNRFVSFWKEQGGEFFILQHQSIRSLRLNQFTSSDRLLPEVGILP